MLGHSLDGAQRLGGAGGLDAAFIRRLRWRSRSKRNDALLPILWGLWINVQYSRPQWPSPLDWAKEMLDAARRPATRIC